MANYTPARSPAPVSRRTASSAPTSTEIFQRLDEALAGLDGRKPELRLGRLTGDGRKTAVALGAPGGITLLPGRRLCWPGRCALCLLFLITTARNMLILSGDRLSGALDRYEVGLSDNDFLPSPTRRGELPLSGLRAEAGRLGLGLNLSDV